MTDLSVMDDEMASLRRHRAPIRLPPFAATLALALAAGCGDGGSSDPDPDATPAALRVDSIDPVRGPRRGGTRVTARGAGFTGGEVRVVVGPREVTATVTSDTELQFSTPAHDMSGPVDVVVFGDAGTVRLDGAFSYNPLPTLDSVEPAAADAAGGTELTLRGSGFTAYEAGNNLVTVGGVAVAAITFMADDELRVVTAADGGAPFRAADVRVQNANGLARLDAAVELAGSGMLVAGNRNAALDGARLYHVDPATGATYELGLVGDGTRGVSGLAVADDGSVWAAAHFASFACCERALLSIDPFRTESAAIVGVLAESGTGADRGIQDLTFAGGAVIGANRDDQRLVAVSTADATWTAIGATPLGSMSGVGLARRSDTEVWLAHRLDGDLLAVDAADSTITETIALDGPALRVRGLTVHDGILYAATRGTTADPGAPAGSELVAIDPTTGAVTPIVALPPWTDAIVSIAP